MSENHSWLPAAAVNDRRFRPAAYEFLYEALDTTRRRIAGESETEVRHISGAELLEGFRQLAQEHFGLLAKTVLNSWGIHCTADVGEMVFRLVESGDFLKTESDHRTDFDNVYEFDEAFLHSYHIRPKEETR